MSSEVMNLRADTRVQPPHLTPGAKWVYRFSRLTGSGSVRTRAGLPGRSVSADAAVGRYGGSAARAGFTLVELTIVMLILVILATLATSVGSSAVRSARSRSTLVTMQVVEFAIRQFADEGAGRHADRYGRFPPDNYTYGDGQEDPNDLDGDGWDFNGSWPAAEPPVTDYNGNLKYDPAYLDNDIAGFCDIEPVWPPGEDPFRSIETLYLYLTRLSPRARTALDKLPSGRVTNQDADVVVLDTNGNGVPDPPPEDQRIDLFELTDTWNRPLRYEVLPGHIGGTKWELRSAGPDGVWAECGYVDLLGDSTPMFCPEEDSGDDVILNGS